LSSRGRVVIVGGGFAGTRVAQDVARQRNLADVILIDRKAHFEVTYATLRAMVEPLTIGRRFAKKYADFVRGDFIHGTVVDLIRLLLSNPSHFKAIGCYDPRG